MHNMASRFLPIRSNRPAPRASRPQADRVLVPDSEPDEVLVPDSEVDSVSDSELEMVPDSEGLDAGHDENGPPPFITLEGEPHAATQDTLEAQQAPDGPSDSDESKSAFSRALEYGWFLPLCQEVFNAAQKTHIPQG